ncbi:MAG: hypothetical protein AAGB32_04400 [Pseudomonadota bacterium]
MTNHISPIFWLWVPLAFFITQIFIEIFAPDEFVSGIVSENGLYEVLQALIVFVGFIICLVYFFSKKTDKHPYYITWFGLAAVCCLYVVGEEISWGQHLFNWATPEGWSELNDQNETNLHNMSSWFDQKLRLILLIAIVFGSLILPYLLSKKVIKLSAKLTKLCPPKEFGVLGLLVLVPHIVDKILETQGISFFNRFSEVQELYFFYFVAFYLLNLYKITSKSEKS